MKMGLAEVDWKYVGAVLANQDDHAQVEFFRAFVKESRSWGTAFQVEQQMAFVNMKLTKDERETLRMLGFEEGAHD